MRLLLAEDEPDLNNLIVQKLKKEGYAVDSCLDGMEAFHYLTAASYDAAILDIMMPNMDGLTLLHRIRELGIRTPVLFLTARDSIDDRVEGLDAGASDYLVKPYSFKELLARIRVMLREHPSQAPSIFYRLADLTVDSTSHQVTRQGNEIPLSAREFAVLECLIRNQGRVLSREQIENSVWDFDYEGSSNMIDVYIRYLRKKIDDNYEPKLIHTVRGVGYVMKVMEARP